MAKTGLDYFPFDVDFFDDDKISLTATRFGIKGELIAVKLLCRIYKNGYYSEFNEDIACLFAKRAGEGITPTLVNEVVNDLIKRGFFDEAVFNSIGVLTSFGIQKRYINVCDRLKRKAEIINKIKCFDVRRKFGESSENFPEEVKESKVKESKVNYLIKIGKEIFFKNGSEILLDEYRQVLDQHLMGSLKNFTEQQVLLLFDEEYPSYDFKDRNHLSNSVKFLKEKLEKNSAKKENGKFTSKTESTISGITEILESRGININDHLSPANDSG